MRLARIVGVLTGVSALWFTPAKAAEEIVIVTCWIGSTRA